MVDAFRLKKQQMLEQRLQQKNHLKSKPAGEVKIGKTKEELAEIRKNMMKQKSKASSSETSQQQVEN